MSPLIFISYAHADRKALDRLHIHLAPLRREGAIRAWSDREITAGELLDPAIAGALENSDLFVALLSPDYLHSRYCYEVEFERAQGLAVDGRVKIIPVVLEPCDWLSTPFSAYRALPDDGKPVSVWTNENEAFLDIVKGLRAILLKPPGRAKDAARPSDPKDADTGAWKLLRTERFDERIENIFLTGSGDELTVLFNAPGRFERMVVSDGRAETLLEVSAEPSEAQARHLLSKGMVSIYSRSSGRMAIYTFSEIDETKEETLEAHSEPPTMAALSVDDTRFVSGDTTGELHIWDWQKRSLQHTLTTIIQEPQAAAFSLDCQHLAVINSMGDLELFDLVALSSVGTAKAGVRGRRCELAFSLDGSSVVAMDEAERWDVISAESLNHRPRAEWEDVFVGLRSAKDGTLIASSAAGTVIIAERLPDDGEIRRTRLGSPGRRVVSMAISDDAKSVALVLDYRELRVYARSDADS